MFNLRIFRELYRNRLKEFKPHNTFRALLYKRFISFLGVPQRFFRFFSFGNIIVDAVNTNLVIAQCNGITEN